MAHIQHLIEDRDIKLSTIQEIIQGASRADIHGVTEKLDGVNIMFTCTPKYETRFARTESDIRAGGMIRAVLEAKFTGRGVVQDTFAEGSSAISKAVRQMSPTDVKTVFDNGSLWYSAEIIYTKNPNVVHYATDCVVFHRTPTLRLSEGIVSRKLDTPFPILDSNIPYMDHAAQQAGWRVYGPREVVLRRGAGTSIYHDVEDAVIAMSLDKDVTLQECLERYARHELKELGVRGSLLDDAAKRLAKSSDAPSLTTLRSKLPTRALTKLRASDDWIANHLKRLDISITRFSAELLANVQSSLVNDNEAEVQRLRERLHHCIKLITDSRNPAAIAYLEKQMERMGIPENLATAVEGIVFPWGDKLYKLTGAFAPANAIMGLVKYGRGRAIPPIGG